MVRSVQKEGFSLFHKHHGVVSFFDAFVFPLSRLFTWVRAAVLVTVNNGPCLR